MTIHATAVVDPRAEIAQDVSIGPYVVIEGPVRIGPGCHIGAHAYLEGQTTIGKNCAVHPFAVIGGTPQDFHYQGGQSSVTIGDGSVIREYATIHRATAEGGATTVGARCLIMAYAHVGHDCTLDSGVVIGNGAQCAGHVQIGADAVLSASCLIHQFCRIGRRAMGVAGARIVHDVPPFLITDIEGGIARVNVIGCRREGLSPESIAQIKSAFRALYRSTTPFSIAVEQLRSSAPGPEVAEILDFVAAPSRLGVAGPARRLLTSSSDR